MESQVLFGASTVWLFEWQLVGEFSISTFFVRGGDKS